MLFLLIILITVSLSFRTGAPNSRIIGGGNTEIESFPHQVSVEWLEMHICSGTIISQTYVITAAHCLEYKNLGDITIRAGTSILEAGGTVIGAGVIYIHNLYQRNVIDGIPRYYFDIAIIELKEPLKLDKVQIDAVALVDEGTELADATNCLVVGWGAVSEDDEDVYSKQLQVVEIQNIALDRCRAVYDPDDSDIVDSDLCAGVKGGGKGFCNGDAGGPLFQYNGGIQDRELYGVASWQIGCGEAQHPGIYTSIGYKKVRDFVKATTGL